MGQEEIKREKDQLEGYCEGRSNSKKKKSNDSHSRNGEAGVKSKDIQKKLIGKIKFQIGMVGG